MKLKWQDQQAIERDAMAIVRAVSETAGKGDEHDAQVTEIQRLAEGILNRVREGESK